MKDMSAEMSKYTLPVRNAIPITYGKTVFGPDEPTEEAIPSEGYEPPAEPGDGTDSGE